MSLKHLKKYYSEYKILKTFLKNWYFNFLSYPKLFKMI